MTSYSTFLTGKFLSSSCQLLPYSFKVSFFLHACSFFALFLKFFPHPSKFFNILYVKVSWYLSSFSFLLRGMFRSRTTDWILKQASNSWNSNLGMNIDYIHIIKSNSNAILLVFYLSADRNLIIYAPWKYNISFVAGVYYHFRAIRPSSFVCNRIYWSKNTLRDKLFVSSAFSDTFLKPCRALAFLYVTFVLDTIKTV